MPAVPAPRRAWAFPGWPTGTVLACLGIFVLDLAAVRLAPGREALAGWWPAAGLAVLGLASAPPRRRVAVVAVLAAVTALAVGVAGRPPLLSLGLGVVNGLAAAVVVWVLARGRTGGLRLQTLDDLWRLVVGAALGGLVVGIGIGTLLGIALDPPFWAVARAVAAAEVASVLLVVPLGLDVTGPPTGARRTEQAVQALLTAGALVAVFAPGQHLPLDFLPIPLLVWGALRVNLRLATVELLGAGIVATTMTALGHGPTGTDQVRDGLSAETTSALVQSYLVCLALVVLPLAVTGLQRRSALAEARAGEEQFRRSFTESLIGMMLLRPTEQGLLVEEANDVAASQLGSRPDRLVGRVWHAGLSPDDEQRLRDACAEVLAGELGSWSGEVRLGSEPSRWTRLAVTGLDRPGGLRLLSVQLVDLSAERDALEELEAARDFTEAVLDSTNVLMVVVDHEGRVVRFNPAAEALSGWRVEEVVGRPVWDVLGPEVGVKLRAHLGLEHPEHDHHQVEEEWTTRSGDRRTVVWACALLDPERADSHLVMSGIDVTEERAAQSLVDQVLAATTGTSIIGTDPAGTITFFNPGAERLLGYSAEELVGRATPTMLHDPDELQQRADELGLDSTFGVLVAGVRAGGAPEKRDWHYRRKDGTPIVMSLTVSPMTGASGRVVGYLGVAEDVTERRRVEDLLRQALAKERQVVERLNEVDQATAEFISTVSHELRTPITSVLGYTEMLQAGSGGALTERQARLLARVESNGQRLQALIEDLLTLSRLEGGTFRMASGPVDLGDVVRAAVEATEVARAERDLRFEVQLAESPVLVPGDAEQLERAVSNLVSNAVKFTPDGGQVTLTLTVSGDEAVVCVEDTGIGIPAAEQHRLFERFYRSTPARKRAIPGTGLGLSIVQGIAAGHGGTVSVRSREGHGTRVELRVPRQPAARRVSGPGGSAGPRPGGGARRDGTA